MNKTKSFYVLAAFALMVALCFTLTPTSTLASPPEPDHPPEDPPPNPPEGGDSASGQLLPAFINIWHLPLNLPFLIAF